MKLYVKTAFSYGKIDKELFMEVPQGFNIENNILKLEKITLWAQTSTIYLE